MSSIYISEFGVYILYLLGWRIKFFQINIFESQKQIYISWLYKVQILDLYSQIPPDIFISHQDQRDQQVLQDPQVFNKELFKTIDLFSWVTSCLLIRRLNYLYLDSQFHLKSIILTYIAIYHNWALYNNYKL